MAKSASSDVLDGALNVVKNNATRMTACSAEPTTFAEANATYALADVTMAGSDFTLADGLVSGRRLIVAAKGGVVADASGNATHVALLDVAGSRLLYVTTCPSQAVAAGGDCSFDSWDIEIGAPI
jgi:hypothetical protein